MTAEVAAICAFLADEFPGEAQHIQTAAEKDGAAKMAQAFVGLAR